MSKLWEETRAAADNVAEVFSSITPLLFAGAAAALFTLNHPYLSCAVATAAGYNQFMVIRFRDLKADMRVEEMKARIPKSALDLAQTVFSGIQQRTGIHVKLQLGKAEEEVPDIDPKWTN